MSDTFCEESRVDRDNIRLALEAVKSWDVTQYMKNGKCSLCSCESTEIPVSDVSHFSANRHGVVFVSSQNGSVHMFEMRDQSLTCLKLLHAREDSRGLALATSHRNGTIIMSSFQDNTLGVWLLDM